MLRRWFFFLFLMVALAGCQWHSDSYDSSQEHVNINIQRYDRVESQYLSMADFAALQQLKTDFPLQTRNLIENVLQLGPVNDPEINTRWLIYFQDSTLQALIKDVNVQYHNLDDINRQFTMAFRRLSQMLPDLDIPSIYTQIGSLDQSIVVADSLLGISLDKYLGTDYPAYLRYGYSQRQRSMMTRDFIVPDGLGFYLLSCYPMPQPQDSTDISRQWHMSKIQYVVNRAMNRQVFHNDTIRQIEQYMKAHPHMPVDSLLRSLSWQRAE